MDLWKLLFIPIFILEIFQVTLEMQASLCKVKLWSLITFDIVVLKVING